MCCPVVYNFSNCREQCSHLSASKVSTEYPKGNSARIYQQNMKRNFVYRSYVVYHFLIFVKRSLMKNLNYNKNIETIHFSNMLLCLEFIQITVRCKLCAYLFYHRKNIVCICNKYYLKCSL